MNPTLVNSKSGRTAEIIISVYQNLTGKFWKWKENSAYQSKGYTKTKTFCDTAGHPHDATHWTQKGKHFIVGEFEKLGIYANGGNQK